MADPFADYQKGLDSPADRHFNISPNDTADLVVVPRSIFVGIGGTLVLRDEAGQDVTYTVPAGMILPFRAVRVLNTGTTASGLVGWY